MQSIVVIDDDKNICSLFEELFQKKYEIHTAYDGYRGLKMVRTIQPDLILLDIRMPKTDGMKLLKQIKKELPGMIVMMITATNDASTAIQAMKLGAYDYIIKPFDIDEIQLNIKNALEKKRLEEEVKNLRAVVTDRYCFDQLIGKSEVLQEVYSIIQKVLDNNSTVLIRGESGTGKELVAHAIHYNSVRNSRSFITVNMAAIPSNLLESELFGHEKGAFTGALYQKIGKFEQANTGTIFLDEIGSLEYPLQAKILRVLQEKEVERVGSQSSIPIDVRVIAATSSDLEDAIDNNKFRPDLFYRLNVVPIYMPALRDRLEDIPLLVNHFIEETNKKFKKKVKKISPEALEILSGYSWPGNIRELKNMIERIMVMMSKDETVIDKPHFPPGFVNRISDLPKFKTGRDGSMLEDMERKVILETFSEYNENITKTAKILGITRKTLRTKLQKYSNEGYIT